MIEKAQKPIDLKLLKNIEPNQWVAFSPDYKKILASSNTLNTLSKKVNLQKAVVMKVLPAMISYIPYLG